jgi:peptidoglycan/xylan/chitin deacetylase (PgdA/CDA1 family)
MKTDLKMARRLRLPRALLAFILSIVALAGTAGSTWAAQSAVVFMYHRFGENSYPTTNIRLDQFDAHLEQLANGRYTVLPVPEILRRTRAGEALPDRTIGITIDDAYLSVYQHAWPRLRAAGLPFTLFVATDPIDRGIGGYMNWAQIRELAEAGVTIGSQTATHPHMPAVPMARSRDELRISNERFTAELGAMPRLFAYPYGETSTALMALVRDTGFDAAFGQHSGVVHAGEDRYYLPRFALNEQFGDRARFVLGAGALPLPVTDVTPADPLLRSGLPAFGFTVDETVGDLAGLACYASGQGRARLERLGDRRIEVRLEEALPNGRARINCTMPGPENRWRWYGRQFYVMPR